MPKLIYLYINNINRKIINQDINFSNDFKVTFKQGELKIEKNVDNIMKHFWGEKIENITLLIGKNGVGKTSILDLIGSNEKTIKHNFENGKYFLIYHVYDDYYYFKGTMRKDISNIQDDYGSKTTFYFKEVETNLFKKTASNNSDQLNIYYSRNKIIFPWAGDKKLYKGDDNRLLKYLEMNANIEDALNTYSKFDLFDNANRAVRIEQKINYLNNPRYLSFLYEMDQENLDPKSVSNLFLNTEGNELNNLIYKKYRRSEQDKLFDKVDLQKEYFILRILEKIYLVSLSEFLFKERRPKNKEYEYYEYGDNRRDIDIKQKQEFKYNVLKDVLRIRQLKFQLTEKEDCNEEQILENKINYLHEVLTYLYEHIKRNNFPIRIIDITDLLVTLYSIPLNYFKNKNIIEIPSDDEFFTKNVSYLKDSYNDIFNFKFTNFSDGEFIYLNLFSSLYKYIEHSDLKDCILLLDEPDINLHPEWSRKLIYDVIKLVQNHKKGGKVQIIVTSHSPFIVTDLPKENIFAFKLDKKTKNYFIANPEFGFAANFYDLLTDTFFMEASIGEFAVKKIQSIKGMEDKRKANEIINKIDDIFIKKHIRKGFD
jgi:predicted ATP-dependent endonuclease of OLD family